MFAWRSLAALTVGYMDAPLWIDLEGADNARDVGGLPTLDGRQTQPGRGIVVAIALREVGVTPEAIVADYARSADLVDAVQTRLSKRPAYAEELAGSDPARHKPRAATMEKVLAAIDEIHGGAGTWLRANGWTDRAAAALRHKLLDIQPVPIR